MAWVLLVVAGLLEVVWAIGVKYTNGFSRLVPTVLTAASLLGSILLLGQATRTIPIGTAYAVWVGIGALGTALVGMVVLGEAATPSRLFFLALLLTAVIGLRLSSTG